MIEGKIGVDHADQRPIISNEQWCDERGALFDSMTVEDNIAFPLREAGMRDVKTMRARVNEVLEVVELEGENAKMPESLSGGMRKRVGLARAIIRRSSCVLYDEPTSGLDPVVSDSINR